MNEKMRMYEIILDDLMRDYPSVYSRIVEWYPSGRNEITVRTNDDKVIAYNGFARTLRNIHDPEDDSEYMDDIRWREEFSRQLRRKLSNSDLTQEDLSNLTGISKVTISKYICGKATPSGSNLCKLARALACTVSDLAEFR